jgi:single-strand DNA-binding protein
MAGANRVAQHRGQRLAKIVGEYVKKGAKLYIEGKLQTSSWDDRESGTKKYRTEIVARDLVLLGSHENSSNGEDRFNRNGDQHESAYAG